jgi:hypothetical protein
MSHSSLAEKIKYLNILATGTVQPQRNRERFVLYIKAKAMPLQALRIPEGPRRLRLPDFKTIGT